LASKLVTAQGLFFTEAQVDLHRLVINGSGISDLSLGPVALSYLLSDSDSHTLSNQSTQQPRVSYLDSNSGDDPQVEILLRGGRGVQHDPFRISFSALDEIQRAHELPDELFEQFQAKKGYFTATHLLEREVAGDDQSLSHALRYVNVAVGDFGYLENFYCVVFRLDLMRCRAFCLYLCGVQRIDAARITELCRDLHADILENPMTLLWILVKEQSWALGLKQPGSQDFQSYYRFGGNLGLTEYAQIITDYRELTRTLFITSQATIELGASFETKVRLCKVISDLNSAVGIAHQLRQDLSPRKLVELSIASSRLSERLQILKGDLEDQVSQYQSYVSILQSQFSCAGDQIYIFLGPNIPFAIRKREDMTAQFLGEYYVFGLMHGEAAKGCPEDKLEDVLLV
jgi:hypothetical protein